MDRGEMTEISGNNLGFLMGDERSPRQMVEFLKEGAQLRSFGDVLRQVYPHEDLAARLTGGLGEITGDSRDSLAKKVRNWLKGQNMPHPVSLVILWPVPTFLQTKHIMQMN